MEARSTLDGYVSGWRLGDNPRIREGDVVATVRVLERLNAQDFGALLWDGHGWSGDIGVLAILEGTSLLDDDGRVRIEDVHRALEPRLHRVPRFRQRLYRPPRGL